MVEFIIAIGLFSIVVSIAMGSFVRALRTQRQLISLISSNSNISLAMEQLAREIRTGRDFCAGACAGSTSTLTFENANKQKVLYCLQGGAVRRGVEVIDCNDAQSITPEKVRVTNLQFKTMGLNTGDELAPRVTILISVSPLETGVESSEINLQTTISARFLVDN